MKELTEAEKAQLITRPMKRQGYVRNMRRRAANVYGEGNPTFARFGFDGINRLEKTKKPSGYHRRAFLFLC